MPFDDLDFIARYEPAADTPYVAKLVFARKLVAAGWIQGEAAMAPTHPISLLGEEGPTFCTCGPNDPYAVKFCAIGALQRAWEVDDPDFFLNGEPRPDNFILGFVNKSPDPINDPLYENRLDDDDDVVIWPEIPEWNDDGDTDQKTVLKVFDQAIAFAREKGL